MVYDKTNTFNKIFHLEKHEKKDWKQDDGNKSEEMNQVNMEPSDAADDIHAGKTLRSPPWGVDEYANKWVQMISLLLSVEDNN